MTGPTSLAQGLAGQMLEDDFFFDQCFPLFRHAGILLYLYFPVFARGSHQLTVNARMWTWGFPVEIGSIT